ncbi:MAG: porin [Opitutales bacterium]
MKSNKWTTIAALSLTFLGGSSAFANTNDALLDLLVKKGVLTKQEATEVAEEVERNKAADKQTESDREIAFSAKGKETIKLRFNGRMQAQYDALSMEENGTDLPSTNHFYFRRLFLGAKAELENGMYAETVLDFAGDENPDIAFDKAVFGYAFNDALNARMGYQKVPFGFEETSSSSKLPAIERSAANRFFADDIDFSSRHTGLHATGALGNGFRYAGAFVNAAQGEGSRLLGSSNASNDMAAFGRLQWQSNDLTLGVDGGTQSNNSVVNDDVTAFTGYVNYKMNGLDLLGEYFTADMEDAEDVDGYALRASYRLDKFEPVVRYAHLKADSFEIDSDELIRRAPSGGTVSGTDNEIDSFYVGLNYYISPAVTFMAGYEYAEAENAQGADVEINGFRSRLQLLW